MLESKILRTGKNTILRCVVDLIDGGVSIDHCARLNKEIGRFLEEEDILPDNFTIEVNSPGIDRPLHSEKDFLRVKGRYVNLWFKEAIDGKDFIEGKISDVKDEKIFLEYKGELLSIEIINIKIGKEKIGFK